MRSYGSRNGVGYFDALAGYDLIPGSASTQTAAVNQAIASGGSSSSPNPPGSEQHHEDYAVPEDSSPTLLTDDYITQGRTPHPDNCIADYMHTSKSAHGNYYGWSWSSDIGPAFVSYANQQNPAYSASYTNYFMGSSLTWSILTNEIDNDRPMVFLVDSDGNGSTDHFVTVIGYRITATSTQQYGCLDTWYGSTIRWEDFQQMAGGVPWGIYCGCAFSAIPIEPEEVDADVDIDPDSLNLKSKGKWVTFYIQPPEGYDVSDIDVDSILLEGLLGVQQSDVQNDRLMVKFDRQDLIAYVGVVLGITSPGYVNLVVTGELTDGVLFEGLDEIRIIHGYE